MTANLEMSAQLACHSIQSILNDGICHPPQRGAAALPPSTSKCRPTFSVTPVLCSGTGGQPTAANLLETMVAIRTSCGPTATGLETNVLGGLLFPELAMDQRAPMATAAAVSSSGTVRISKSCPAVEQRPPPPPRPPLQAMLQPRQPPLLAAAVQLLAELEIAAAALHLTEIQLAWTVQAFASLRFSPSVSS